MSSAKRSFAFISGSASLSNSNNAVMEIVEFILGEYFSEPPDAQPCAIPIRNPVIVHPAEEMRPDLVKSANKRG